jgi:spore maturation protein CgeB
VAPLLKQLRNDHNPDVIQTLNELQPALSQALQKKVQTQIEYFESHQNRMHYREIIKARKALAKDTATETQRLKANEPLGSGAIVSTCRQYQCRFKRTGQFWSAAGDEALMCLETFWRNGRWHELYPHAKLASPSLN